jgi:hypothetical protein
MALEPVRVMIPKPLPWAYRGGQSGEEEEASHGIGASEGHDPQTFTLAYRGLPGREGDRVERRRRRGALLPALHMHLV